MKRFGGSLEDVTQPELLIPGQIEQQAKSWARKAMKAKENGDGRISNPDHNHEAISFVSREGWRITVTWNIRYGKSLAEVAVWISDEKSYVLRWGKGGWFMVKGGMPENPPEPYYDARLL